MCYVTWWPCWTWLCLPGWSPGHRASYAPSSSTTPEEKCKPSGRDSWYIGDYFKWSKRAGHLNFLSNCDLIRSTPPHGQHHLTHLHLASVFNNSSGQSEEIFQVKLQSNLFRLTCGVGRPALTLQENWAASPSLTTSLSGVTLITGRTAIAQLTINIHPQLNSKIMAL